MTYLAVPISAENVKKAKQQIRKAKVAGAELLELRPGPSATSETNYRLAEIYISLGKRDRAVGHLLAAVKKAPEGRWGKKSEEYLKVLR